MPYEFDQIPYPLVYEEQAAFKDTYGGAEGVVVCESYLLKPKVESDTVLVFMHPVGGGAYLPMVRHLARAGHHVIYCNSRYRSDVALIMEKVVLDLGACVRDAKERLGYAKVVLAGWSGGGALVALLPGASREAVGHRDAGGRLARPDCCWPRARGRRHVVGRAHESARRAHAEPRPVDPRRA